MHGFQSCCGENTERVMTEEQLLHGNITRCIIGAAMEVHGQLGPGFLESVYEEALAYEFELQGISFERQRSIDVAYKGKSVKQFVCDYLVEGRVVVELKAIKTITNIEKCQLINYLKATRLRVGLLLNFGAQSLEYKRLMN